MTIWSVTSTTQLYSALASAVGGDTINLAAGNYGKVSLANYSFASNVTIASAPGGAMAHFDGLSITGSKNVTLQSVDIGRALLSGEADWTALSTVTKSSNITLKGVSIHGSLDGNPLNDGIGLQASGNTNFKVVNAEFQQLTKGIVAYDSNGVTIANSRFHDLRSDGVNSAGNYGLTIDNNSFTDFYPGALDHPDAIQIFNTGRTRGQKDISITNNVIMQGRGYGIQGIFIAAPGTYGYENVAIKNNLINSNDMYNGLTVDGATNLSIIGNTVVSEAGDLEKYWIRLSNNVNTLLQDNFADHLIVEGGSGLTQVNNAILSTDPSLASLMPMLGSLSTLSSMSPGSLTNFIVSGYGYQLPTSSASVSPPPPEPAPVMPALFGTTGNNTISGTAVAESIAGVGRTEANPGRGSVDTLYGRGGADVFLLGDARGVFYDDDAARNAGTGDYAKIMDFGGGDKISLSGAANDYFLASATMNKVAGVQIFHDTNDNGFRDSRDELIGFVVGVQSIGADSFIYG